MFLDSHSTYYMLLTFHTSLLPIGACDQIIYTEEQTKEE